MEPPSYRHVHVPGRSGSSHLASKTEKKPERMLKCDSDHVVSECSPRSTPAGPAVRGVKLLRAGSLGESDEPLTPAGAAGRWLRVAPASQEAGSREARSGRQAREEGLLCPGHSARHGAGGGPRERRFRGSASLPEGGRAGQRGKSSKKGKNSPKMQNKLSSCLLDDSARF